MSDKLQKQQSLSEKKLKTKQYSINCYTFDK